MRMICLLMLMALAAAGPVAGSLGEYQVAAGAAPCLSIVTHQTAGDELACLEPGTRLGVLDEDGDWLVVRLPDRRLGWLRLPCRKLYAVASTDAEEVDCLGPDASVTVLDADGDWRIVRLADGHLGWLQGEAVLEPVEAAEPDPPPLRAAAEPQPPPAPPAAPPVEPTPEITPAPQPVAIVEVSEPSAPAPADEELAVAVTTPPEPEPVPEPEPAPEPEPEWQPAPEAATTEPSPSAASLPSRFAVGLFMVETGGSPCVNIRERPAAGTGMIGCLPQGTVVGAVERHDDWLAVELPDSGKGFIIARALVPAHGSDDSAFNLQPAGSSAAQEEIYEIAPPEAYCVNLRQEPSAESALRGCLPRGTRVTPTTREGAWWQIQMPDGSLAWTIARALKPS